MTSLTHPHGPVPKGVKKLRIRPGLLRDRKYLDWLREQPCLVTGQIGNSDIETVDPAHFRWGTDGGASMKPSDCFATPLLHSMHAHQGALGEPKFWEVTVIKTPRILQEFIKDALRWRYFKQTGKMPK